MTRIDPFMRDLLRKAAQGKKLQKSQIDELSRDGYLTPWGESPIGYQLTVKATNLLERNN